MLELALAIILFGGIVTFRSRSDIRDVERDNEKLAKQNAKLIEQLSKMGRVSKESAKSSKENLALSSSGAKRAIGSVTSLIGSYVSLNAIVGAVNQSLQQQKDLAREALAESKGIAGAQQEAIKNFAGLSREARRELLTRIPTIAKEEGFANQAALIDAFAGAISASGDVRRSESAVRVAARLTRLTPDATRGLAGGAIDIGRASGIVQAEKNVGFLLSAGAQARVEDPTLLAKNLAPAVAQLVTLTEGQDRREASREAGAFFSVLSKDLTDKTGDVTKTVTRQAGLQLRKFFTEGFGTGKNVVKAEVDPGSLFGRLRALSENDELRAKFFSKAALERAKVPLESLLADPERLKELEATKVAIQFDAGLTRQLEADLSKLTKPLQLATAGEASKAATSEFLQKSGFAQRAQVREIAEDALKKTRQRFKLLPGLTEGTELFDLEAKSTAGAIRQAIGALERRQQDIQFGREVGGDPITGRGAIRQFPDRSIEQLPNLQQQQIELLKQQTRVLEGLLSESMKQSGRNKATAAKVQPGRDRD